MYRVQAQNIKIIQNSANYISLPNTDDFSGIIFQISQLIFAHIETLKLLLINKFNDWNQFLL